jgi:hypothetical protein
MLVGCSQVLQVAAKLGAASAGRVLLLLSGTLLASLAPCPTWPPWQAPSCPPPSTRPQ